MKPAASIRPRFAAAIAIGLVLWLMPGPAGAEGFLHVDGPCGFAFPKDHGDHTGYRTEWWYYTGNLAADAGRRFGYQLTFFRSQLRPTASRETWPRPASAWRTDQVYLAHAAITDFADGRHRHWEGIARGALGMAGVRREDAGVRIFLNAFEAVIGPQSHDLAFTAAEAGLRLRLTPIKPLVAHGDGGYSVKGGSSERASCYYSFTRLDTAGDLILGSGRIPVRGLSWMDHEYSTAPLEEGVLGWDWFSIQLDDDTELMIYLLRRKAGGYHPASSGTLVNAEGRGVHLSEAALSPEVVRTWWSPATGAVYPLSWNLRIGPPGDLRLSVRAEVDDQEMVTEKSTRVTYWEGSITVSGTRGGRAVTGRGYMELTGYAGPLDALR